MKHLGDITKINGAEALPVNVIIGGSPCQDLSIAGKRTGLAGERSGLFMEQLRVIKEMRKADEHRGRTGKRIRPRFMVWENVPGAFSSNKGADFGAVLQETIRVVLKEAPPIPMPNKGWPTTGCLVDVEGHWSIAWRVFDAQFWGVPQRRRRIALVADFGGLTAPEILFERKGVSGYYPQGRTPWERATGSSEKCVRDSSAKGLAFCIQDNCIDRADTAGCNGRGWTEDKSYTLNTVDRPAVYDARGNGDGNTLPTMTGDHNNRVTDYSAIVVWGYSQAAYDKFNEDDKTATLKAQGGSYGGGSETLIVDEAKGFPLGFRAENTKRYDETATTLCNGTLPGWCHVDCRNGNESAVNGTLQAKENGGSSVNLNNVVRENCLVRRLTPLECERLQGFPDYWTNIDSYTGGNGKEKKTTDSARYKALGNSIAIPPWFYVLQKLTLCCGDDTTMASLFDGIGGFPLIWEMLNGKGSCLWASEIEKFPIAVTKVRFHEEV